MRRFYIGYPLAVAFGLGVFLAGIEPVVGLAPPSISVALLPDWLERWWELSYALGGLGLAGGILTRHRGIEAAGLALLGGTFPVQAWLTLVAFGAVGRPGATFLGVITFGCWIRFYLLQRKVLA